MAVNGCGSSRRNLCLWAEVQLALMDMPEVKVQVDHCAELQSRQPILALELIAFASARSDSNLHLAGKRPSPHRRLHLLVRAPSASTV